MVSLRAFFAARDARTASRSVSDWHDTAFLRNESSPAETGAVSAFVVAVILSTLDPLDLALVVMVPGVTRQRDTLERNCRGADVAGPVLLRANGIASDEDDSRRLCEKMFLR